jgi:hypothetical protein
MNTLENISPLLSQTRKLHMKDVFYVLVLYISRTKTCQRQRTLLSRKRKIASSIPDVNELFQFNESFQPHYGPGVNSALTEIRDQEPCWG